MAQGLNGGITLPKSKNLDKTKSKDESLTAAKEIAIPTTPRKRPVFFPPDPNAFIPNGLVRHDYVGTKNGSIILWSNPFTNKPVFTWHENSDHDNGSHYHIEDLNKGKKNKDHPHFYPGSLVPEPYASIYFS